VVALLSAGIVSHSGQAVWNAPPGPDGSNAYTQRWVAAARALMLRYGSFIKFYEIWNEPNHCARGDDHLSVCNSDPLHTGESFIRPDLYAKLLAETYAQNHDVITGQGLHLVFGGIYAHDLGGGPYIADDYINAVYSSGVWSSIQQQFGRRYVWDRFAFHVYTATFGSVAPDAIQQYLVLLGSLRSDHGDLAKVFITEHGWPTPQVSEATQAHNLDVALGVYEAHDEVELTSVYRLNENCPAPNVCWGLFRGNRSPKPAVDVYKRHAAGCIPDPPPPPPRDGGTVADLVEADAVLARDAASTADLAAVPDLARDLDLTVRDGWGATGALACPCFDGDGQYCAEQVGMVADLSGCSIPVGARGIDLLGCQGGQWRLAQACGGAGCSLNPPADDFCTP
jgi:hypothetical protein